MKTIEMTDKELFAAELALRTVLCELLEREDSMIELIQVGAHNMAIGSFGDKGYKPKDSQDWIQYLQPMRDLIDKLASEHRKRCEELGDSHYILPEEEMLGIHTSTKYKEALAKMNSIKDRPICVFVWNDLNMPNRIQTMSIVAAEHLEQKGAGKITVANFNNHIRADWSNRTRVEPKNN